MIVIGLTGSIAMGKSTIGEMMRDMKIPVHESDQAVHDLLKPDSEARPAIASAFPYFDYPKIYNRKTGEFNRKEFGDLIFNDDNNRSVLEFILHPLVRKKQNEFIREGALKGCDIVCLDIPLLFETGAEKRVDYIISVSAPPFVQRERALARPNMTEEKLDAILERQMPDVEKCKRSDYVIKTGLSLAHSMKELKKVIIDIRENHNDDIEEEKHEENSTGS